MGSAAQTVWPQELFTSIANACASSGFCCGVCSISSNMLNDFYACFIPVSSGSLSGTESAAAFIVGIFLFLITLSFFSYFLSILNLHFSLYKQSMSKTPSHIFFAGSTLKLDGRSCTMMGVVVSWPTASLLLRPLKCSFGS